MYLFFQYSTFMTGLFDNALCTLSWERVMMLIYLKQSFCFSEKNKNLHPFAQREHIETVKHLYLLLYFKFVSTNTEPYMKTKGTLVLI